MKRKPGAASQPMPFKALHRAGEWIVTTTNGRTTQREHALELSILTPALATPSGNLVGIGVVTRRGDTVVITA